MALMLAHADPSTGALIGVWTSPKDSYYPGGMSPARYYAAARMGSQLPDLDWDEWCEYLDWQRPNSVAWFAVPAKDSETAQQAFARLAAESTSETSSPT